MNNELNNTLIELRTENMNNYYLKLATKNMIETYRKYIIGATINNNASIAWFNGQAYHSAPISLNLLHNTIIRTIFNDNYGINVINKPIFDEYSAKSEDSNIGFYLATYTGLVMTVITSFWIILYIKVNIKCYSGIRRIITISFQECEFNAKLIQFISGVNSYAYWISSFIWDYLNIMITEILMIVTLLLFNEDCYSTFTELYRLIVILLIFNFASIWLSFIISTFFTVPSNGFVRMLIFNMLTGEMLFFINSLNTLIRNFYFLPSRPIGI